MEYRQTDNNTGELKFYGDIAEWWISGDDFDRTLQEMQTKFNTINIRVHCFGGSVFEGTVIYNSILRYKTQAKIVIYIDGVAASMMAIVMLAANSIIIADNAFVMIHCPSGVTQGTAKDHLAAAKLMDSMEANFCTSIIRKTGKTEAEVRQWLDGSDHWFSATEAKAAGLVDTISSSVVANVIQLSKPDKNDQTAQVFDRYAALLNQPQQPVNNTVPMPFVPLSARDFNALTNFYNTFQNSMITTNINAGWTWDDWQKNDPNALAALEDSNPNAFYTLYKAKYGTVPDGVKFTPVATANAFVAGGNSGRQSWTWDDWNRNDPNALAALENSNPNAYYTLYNAKFGKVPSGVRFTPTAVTVAATNNVPGRQYWTWDDWQQNDPNALAALEDSNPNAFYTLYKAKYGKVPSGVRI